MRLRNKKTGEIREDSDLGKMLSRYEMPSFESIAELCENWEDCASAEPLIKDEKIRKAVRAWAEANDIERVWHEYLSCWLRGSGLTIEMENEIDELEQGNFTIAELCGEEEE